jgi:hypothetical protein
MSGIAEGAGDGAGPPAAEERRDPGAGYDAEELRRILAEAEDARSYDAVTDRGITSQKRVTLDAEELQALLQVAEAGRTLFEGLRQIGEARAREEGA